MAINQKDTRIMWHKYLPESRVKPTLGVPCEGGDIYSGNGLGLVGFKCRQSQRTPWCVHNNAICLEINEISSMYSSSYRPQHPYIRGDNNILLTYPSRLIWSGMLRLAGVEQEVDLDYSMRQHGQV